MTALARTETFAPMEHMQAFAEAAVRSRFYGFKSAEEMLPLMIIAQSQGRSFTSVVEEYSVINGRPALKSESMLARFQKAGGHIKWTELSDTRCAAIFSHAQCDPVEVDWDMDRAKAAGLGGREMWKKYPRNMLKARVISDGVRTAYPACLGGVYTPEELGDLEPAHSPSPPAVRGQLAAPNDAGQHEEPSEPPPSSANVSPTGQAVKDYRHDAGLDEIDHTQDPIWDELLKEADTFTNRGALKAWWSGKAELKQQKPHLTKLFYRNEVSRRWDEMAPVPSLDTLGERG